MNDVYQDEVEKQREILKLLLLGSQGEQGL